jgi:hypothetical protein
VRAGEKSAEVIVVGDKPGSVMARSNGGGALGGEGFSGLSEPGYNGG